MKLPFDALRCAGLGLALAGLAACGAPQVERGINDPFEVRNRAVHEFNKGSDRGVIRGLSSGYDAITPEPVQIGISNFSANLGLPRAIVNNLLQFRVDEAIGNSVRLLVNSTVGIGGVLDPATAIGLVEYEADFGETLYRWGFQEGNYVELPFLGPSTERHLIGRLVDFTLDPVRFISPGPQRFVATGAEILDGLGSRSRFKNTIDGILYDSADSYAQTRLLYLETRRFQLQGPDEVEAIDPYEELYGE